MKTINDHPKQYFDIIKYESDSLWYKSHHPILSPDNKNDYKKTMFGLLNFSSENKSIHLNIEINHLKKMMT